MPYSDELMIPPRRHGFATAFMTFVALGAACGVAYYAYYARKNVSKLRKEREVLSEELAVHRTSGAQLKKDLATCKKDFDTEKAARKEADGKVTAAETELSACHENVTDLTQQKAEFDAITKMFRKMIDTGKLEVMVRKGKMVVKFPAAILFPSGSADLTPSGKAALADVAGILKKIPHRRFTIGGHTDNVPIETAAFKNNWELSTARAVRVLEALTQKGVKPNHLVAAGWSEYDPVASNRTAAGRHRNRRIEIILEPMLSKAVIEKGAEGKKAGEKKKASGGR